MNITWYALTLLLYVGNNYAQCMPGTRDHYKTQSVRSAAVITPTSSCQENCGKKLLPNSLAGRIVHVVLQPVQKPSPNSVIGRILWTIGHGEAPTPTTAISRTSSSANLAGTAQSDDEFRVP